MRFCALHAINLLLYVVVYSLKTRIYERCPICISRSTHPTITGCHVYVVLMHIQHIPRTYRRHSQRCSRQRSKALNRCIANNNCYTGITAMTDEEKITNDFLKNLKSKLQSVYESIDEREPNMAYYKLGMAMQMLNTVLDENDEDKH